MPIIFCRCPVNGGRFGYPHTDIKIHSLWPQTIMAKTLSLIRCTNFHGSEINIWNPKGYEDGVQHSELLGSWTELFKLLRNPDDRQGP
jgi:hypothetical protein